MELLERLVQRLGRLLAAAIEALEDDPAAVEAWEREAAATLMRYHQAAYMAGAGTRAIPPEARRQITADVARQLEFLRGFAIEIQEGAEWEAGWRSRAESYAGSIRVPYWRGATKMLPLPAMPAQGTQCMNNCRCEWDVVTVDEEAGDYDAYWRRGADDSCQTCIQRAADWSPLQIREGRLL